LTKRVDEGLAVFDDDGKWWEITGRTERLSSEMKALLSEILSVVPMTFTLIGSVVEGNRLALMVEGQSGLDDNRTYNNAYTFVTEVDLDRNMIVAVREYVDALRVATVLSPALATAVNERRDQFQLLKGVFEEQ
jgi:ketosteroid isomerase-like protein